MFIDRALLFFKSFSNINMYARSGHVTIAADWLVLNKLAISMQDVVRYCPTSSLKAAKRSWKNYGRETQVKRYSLMY